MTEPFDLVARLAFKVGQLEQAIPLYHEALSRLLAEVETLRELVEDLNDRLRAIERVTPLDPPKKKGRPPSTSWNTTFSSTPLFFDPDDPVWEGHD